MRSVTERVERRYLPDCDYITASSPGIADAYRPLSRVGLPRCVLNVFSKMQRPSAARPGVPSLPVTLYWFSQVIGPGRGLEDIVRALSRTPAGSAELHLRGSWSPGYEADIRRLAAQFGLAPERIVTHPLASPDEMVRRSATYDIGLSLEPGGTENSNLALGNKLFTYLLGGQAVIATNTSAQRWLLDQVPGAAVGYDPGDVDTLTGQLLNWIAHRDKLAAAKRASSGVRGSTIQLGRRAARVSECRADSDRVVAVGDAAGLVKPTTGGGIFYGLVSGSLAARVLDAALSRDRLGAADLRRYETAWRRRLGQEIRIGLAFRRIAAWLSDESIDDLIELARVNGVVPLLQQTASFN